MCSKFQTNQFRHKKVLGQKNVKTPKSKIAATSITKFSKKKKSVFQHSSSNFTSNQGPVGL